MITASVVLYRTPKKLLLRLLQCVSESSLPLHVYFVDNSPEGYTPDLSGLPEANYTYIRSPKNVGYGAGHNLALRKVLDSSKFHFVLNPDLSFGPAELAKTIDFMRSNPDVGQLMPKIVYPDGSLQYLCKLIPTPVDLFARRLFRGSIKGLGQDQQDRFELRFTGYDRVMDVPYLSGCFMLFRVSALRTVGLFDERFFMYPEDIDITRRINAQFRTVFFPGATIVHDHARDSYRNLRGLLVHAWNIAKYFNKWGWILDMERTRVNRKVLRELER